MVLLLSQATHPCRVLQPHGAKGIKHRQCQAQQDFEYPHAGQGGLEANEPYLISSCIFYSNEEVLRLCVGLLFRFAFFGWVTTCLSLVVYAVGLTEEDMNKPQVRPLARLVFPSLIPPPSDWYFSNLVGR